jgi:glutamate-ammonia-ligase adenylyltransferase
MRDWLTAKGFSRPDDISSTLSGWMAGRIATTRSERARTLLTRMMPDILDQLAMANAPDDCFAAFAGFVEGLPASVQIFSLLDHNRQLSRLLGDILILSPRLAAQLRRYPMMFDQVIARNFFSPLDDADAFEATIHNAISEMPVELALDVITRLTRERRFRAEVQALSGVADNITLRQALSDTADAAIRVITLLATTDIQRRHGQIAGSFAVLALGRLGIGKMTATSDIDLVLIWDGPSDAQSDGERSLAAAAYFTRLAQTLVSWLGGATGEGSLYEVDARLRPDGEKGALAQSCQRLQTYYNDEAWIWEKMALAKARCLTPHTDAGKTAMQIIATIMAAPPDKAEIATALNQMLTRFRANYTDAADWQLRQKPGGIRELDLLIQALRLQHADLFSHTADTPEAILDKLHAAARLPDELAHALREAAQLFEAVHQALRLIRGTSNDSDDRLSIAAKKFVLTSCDSPDEVTLNTSLEGHRNAVMTALSQLMPPSDGV